MRALLNLAAVVLLVSISVFLSWRFQAAAPAEWGSKLTEKQLFTGVAMILHLLVASLILVWSPMPRDIRRQGHIREARMISLGWFIFLDGAAATADTIYREISTAAIQAQVGYGMIILLHCFMPLLPPAMRLAAGWLDDASDWPATLKWS